MNKIRIATTLLISVTFNILHGQTIIPGGYVSGEWTAAGSPYLVQGNLVVHPDSSLVVGPGTNVLFSGPYWLEVQGQLMAQGTEVMQVQFDKDAGVEFWRGIYFNQTNNSTMDSSLLVNCYIANCKQSPSINLYKSNRVRITACHITNGTAFNGGGINCIGSDLRMEEVTVDFCHALDGAGISLEASSPYMVNCTITNNQADGAGGGLVVYDGSDPLIENCLFSVNDSYGSGGGVYINASAPVFRRCQFNGNRGAIGGANFYSGGAVSVKLNSNPRFENCIFEDNQSYREGGAIASFSPTEIINCLFAGNMALVSGGAVYVGAAGVIESPVHNCTFINNDSPQGSALASLNHKALLKNCILWHQSPANPNSMIYLDAFLNSNILLVVHCDLQNGQQAIEKVPNAQYTWGQGNIDLEPEFEPGTWELSWKSPCIEAGTPDTIGLSLPETDLAGNPRFVNQIVDMGCYEYQFPVLIQNLEFKIQNPIRVYPNPARDHVFVDACEISGIHELIIMNYSGSVVMSGKINSGDSMRIDLNGLPSGYYMIILRNKSSQYSGKFIIIQ